MLSKMEFLRLHKCDLWNPVLGLRIHIRKKIDLFITLYCTTTQYIRNRIRKLVTPYIYIFVQTDVYYIYIFHNLPAKKTKLGMENRLWQKTRLSPTQNRFHEIKL